MGQGPRAKCMALEGVSFFCGGRSVLHNQGLTGCELLGEESEALLALLSCFHSDEVLHLRAKEQVEGTGREFIFFSSPRRFGLETGRRRRWDGRL